MMSGLASFYEGIGGSRHSHLCPPVSLNYVAKLMIFTLYATCKIKNPQQLTIINTRSVVFYK